MKRTYKVTRNQSNKTITVDVYMDNKFTGKYKTIEMCKEDFEELNSMTDSEIIYCMLTSDNFWKIK